MDIHLYKVLSATDSEQALKHFHSATEINLVLINVASQWFTMGKLVEDMKRSASHIPVILIGNPNTSFLHVADACIAENTKPVELLDRIKVWSARKRGPRKYHAAQMAETV